MCDSSRLIAGGRRGKFDHIPRNGHFLGHWMSSSSTNSLHYVSNNVAG